MDNQETEQKAKPREVAVASAMDALMAECAVPLADLLAVTVRQRQADILWTKAKRFGLAVLVLAIVVMQLRTWSALGLIDAPAMGEGVAVVAIRGNIAMGAPSGADRVVPLIESACEASTTKAILLRISSPGGSPSEAERIGAALDRCGKPKSAVIEQLGASAAYLIAVHADRIAADPYAMVGSVGAIMKKVSAEDLARRWGVAEEVYASGDLKFGGSYMRSATPEQASASQSMVDAAGARFVETVRARRKGLAPDMDLASGRMWLAEDAKAGGLIDEVLVVEDAIDAWYGKDAVLHPYAPRRTLADEWSMASVVDAVVARLYAEANGELE